MDPVTQGAQRFTYTTSHLGMPMPTESRRGRSERQRIVRFGKASFEGTACTFGDHVGDPAVTGQGSALPDGAVAVLEDRRQRPGDLPALTQFHENGLDVGQQLVDQPGGCGY